MNPWRWVDPRVRDVRVADIRSYLLGHGWRAGPSPNPRTLVFQRSLGHGKDPFLQAIPAHEDFSDYPRLIAEFITTLSEIEDRHPIDLLNDILGQAGEEGPETRVPAGKPRSRPA